MGNLEEIIQAMADHTRRHPTHGYNCACKDRFIGEARAILGQMDPLAKGEASYLFHCLLRS